MVNEGTKAREGKGEKRGSKKGSLDPNLLKKGNRETL
jgi:hypothetical protein